MSIYFEVQSFEEKLASERSAHEKKIIETREKITIAIKSQELDEAKDLRNMLLEIEKEHELIDPVEIQKAIKILRKEDPMQYLIDFIQLKHTGDLVLGKILFLAIANQSISNSKGIQVHLGGKSGTGKTDLINAIMDTIPELRYKKSGSLSSKNLYYQKNLPNGLIFFCDDIRMNDDLEDTLKQSMTNFQTNTKHSTIINGEACTLMLPKRILWLLPEFIRSLRNTPQPHDSSWV